MTFKKWSDVREGHIERIGIERVVEATNQLSLRLHMQPLVDLRKQRHLTQRDIATQMGLSVGRISQIEAGDVSGIDVLDRYVNALGGRLQLSADFVSDSRESD